LSNGCATANARRWPFALWLAALVLAAIIALPSPARAQEEPRSSSAPDEHPATTVGRFLLGGAAALAAHESGHLLFDGIFNAHAGISRVSFHGIPFFAITHDSGLPRRHELVIDSAGFWVQHASNELILRSHPHLRQDRSPLLKGMYAFNVLASVAYAGAAFARTGPAERDTRGMAEALGWKEPMIGAMILAPALLDAVRYYHPDAKWAKWGSRGAKVWMVLTVAK
jgi:hypothetical protein